ncbi:hypothetical protein COV61_02490 [Candidatus Micrarchaeota archaeon CG11_big_fil_rev_8_21_14_0_20_47_5]|nr:MAG: hypothetical protein AUJ17_02175 [Candidatus Micrarchaeota archaeon CG1_02_47_40]PIN83655.1 MAG: hypothetical protein COV61_02490 [Candidatus Micrarchaeota archaeon CG11_big_fil_rev_8_21_14_0_20_47_5]
MKEGKIFLLHILDSIKNIYSFSEELTKEEFLKDRLRQSAIIRELEIIGEASKNLPKDFTGKYQDVNWTEIAGMRDKLIHHYFGLNLERVWKVVEDDLPVLEEKIKEILEKLK